MKLETSSNSERVKERRVQRRSQGDKRVQAIQAMSNQSFTPASRASAAGAEDAASRTRGTTTSNKDTVLSKQQVRREVDPRTGKALLYPVGIGRSTGSSDLRKTNPAVDRSKNGSRTTFYSSANMRSTAASIGGSSSAAKRAALPVHHSNASRPSRSGEGGAPAARDSSYWQSSKGSSSLPGEVLTQAKSRPQSAPPINNVPKVQVTKVVKQHAAGQDDTAMPHVLSARGHIPVRFPHKTKIDKPIRFYLNLVVMNKKDLVKKEVGKKMEDAWYGGSLTTKLAGSAAARLVKDEMVVHGVLGEFLNKLPELFVVAGVEAEIERKLVEGLLGVVRITVLDVEPLTMTWAEAPEKAPHLEKMIDALKALNQTKELTALWEQMMHRAKDGLMLKMETVLPDQAKETENLDLVAICHHEENEAEFLCEFFERDTPAERDAFYKILQERLEKKNIERKIRKERGESPRFEYNSPRAASI
ncbi:unnamed protein product [Amoebophrya sp. A120]|nr:unnamed protein product [Amoebophrya sp. A120]|eukprot:GSA120T00002619001.1